MQKPNRRSSPPKSFPFSDAQICERAYALWQVQPERSAEEHWQSAIEALKQERSPPWKLRQSWQTAIHKDNRNFTLDVVKVVISAFGVLATIFAGVGLYLTYRNSQAQLESAQQERQLNNERLVTDRFAKAVEQLGNQDIDVRIGAIYSLERIAKDSPKDHWTIMEVLMAFVRNKEPLPKDSKQELSRVTTDVQSALTVIGRREAKNDPENERLALQLTNLSTANLNDANFNSANLNSAALDYAYLVGVKLNGAFLSNTNLGFADLQGAHLQGAYLGGAFFDSANLEDADFTGAHDFTIAQIKAAKNWQKAHYDPDFRQQLGLPEKPNP